MRFDDPLRKSALSNATAQSSTGGLPQGADFAQKVYDKQTPQPGNGSVLGYYDNGRFQRAENTLPPIDFNNANGKALTEAVGRMAMTAQFISGARTGFDVTNTRIPMWSMNGMNFFTAYEPQFSKFEGSGVSVFTPAYLGADEVRLDQRYTNFNNYLDMPNGWDKFWRGFRYSFTGWK